MIEESVPKKTKPTLFDLLVTGLEDQEILTEEFKKFSTIVA